MPKCRTRLTFPILTAGAILILLGTAPPPSSAQTITVTAGTNETISPHLYGVNGQQRNDDLWDQQSNPQFDGALGRLSLNVLRFPAGTGANYWDWNIGDFDGYYASSKSTCTDPNTNQVVMCQSPLSELQSELSHAGTQAKVDFVLNVLTDPTICSYSQAGSCPTLTPSSPNLSYQLQMLSTAGGDNIPISFVELGNEFWNSDADDVAVYPSASDSACPSSTLDDGGCRYATAIVNGNWVSQIRNSDSGVKISAIANYQPPQLTGDNRRIYWNESFFSASSLPQVDALTIHIYRNSDLSTLAQTEQITANLPFNGTGDRSDVVKTMLAVPFHTQDDLKTNYLDVNKYNDGTDANKYELQANNYEKNIWVTEYNLKEPNYAVYGTWAHGLFVAAMGLKFLENQTSSGASRIRMAIQHDTLGSPYFAEIFDSTNGYSVASTVNPEWSLSTNLYQLTAVGLTQEQLNLASAGQTSAAQLSITNDPLINDPSQSSYVYPSLYGWEFSGGGSTQTIILNLGGLPQTVNVTGIAPNGGTYTQIDGDAGAYYQGYDSTTGVYQASYEDSNGPVSDPLTVVSNHTLTISGASSFNLPPYSITRIVSN